MASSSDSSQASKMLQKQFKDLVRDPIDGFSAWLVDENNLFEWNIAVSGLPDTPYEGVVFDAIMIFPKDYPKSPPSVRFTSDIWHPSVGPDRKVSIPILHPPDSGATNCWSPNDTVETIALGIISMLSSFVGESPAKVEAAAVVSQKVTYSMSSTKTFIACSCRDEHVFSDETVTDQFKCDGCKQHGSGKRYKCANCTCELHEECRFPKVTTSHEFFGNLEFQFFDKPQEPKTGPYIWCDACGKEILGFNYQSTDKLRDLHPCCSKLRKKLVVEETLFELHEEEVLSKCIWCEKKKVSNGVVPGWAYTSRCGDYHFHVHCLMEMVHMNASIKDSNQASLQKINLAHLAKSKKKNKKGSKFSTVVKIVITTILSILLGDPTALLAGALVESIFIG